MSRKNSQPLSSTRLYRIWGGMRGRCYCPTATGYKNYGGRGIRVCQAWHNFFEFAIWALASGYEEDLTIDRLDYNGHYEESNCRWATLSEQANNTRANHLLTAWGETKTTMEWSRDGRCLVPYSTLLRRLKEGVPPERALSLPTNATCLMRQKRGSTSRFLGVQWHKAARKWAAVIQDRWLGMFADEEEAARAYDDAALDTWGEYALVNFPAGVV